MLISGVTNTVSTVLTTLAAQQPAANTPPAAAANTSQAAANNAANKDTDGVKFDFSDKALEAVSKNAAQNSAVIAERVAAAAAAANAPVEAVVPAPVAAPVAAPVTEAPAEAPAASAETTTAADASATQTAAARPYTRPAAAEEKPAVAAPVIQQEAEVDPSEESRARAHAEQQLETSRLRNLAIAGYEDTRKLVDVIAKETASSETKAEAAPLRQALTAA